MGRQSSNGKSPAIAGNQEINQTNMMFQFGTCAAQKTPCCSRVSCCVCSLPPTWIVMRAAAFQNSHPTPSTLTAGPLPLCSRVAFASSSLGRTGAVERPVNTHSRQPLEDTSQKHKGQRPPPHTLRLVAQGFQRASHEPQVTFPSYTAREI